jgi:hypothetical protein
VVKVEVVWLAEGRVGPTPIATEPTKMQPSSEGLVMSWSSLAAGKSRQRQRWWWIGAVVDCAG